MCGVKTHALVSLGRSGLREYQRRHQNMFKLKRKRMTFPFKFFKKKIHHNYQ